MVFPIEPIANVVFPVATLPEAVLPAACMAGPAWCVGHRTGKARLDDAPPVFIVGVTLRQRPDAMHVVWQNDPGVDLDRTFPKSGPDRGAQGVDLSCEKVGRPVG